MISIDAALAHYAARLTSLPALTLPLAGALGAVLAEPAVAAVELPLFTQSAVDGYALRSVDLARASGASPVRLQVVGEVAAGQRALDDVAAGTAVRIFTGGALPPGADTVARQEIVQRRGDEITIAQPLAPYADTRLRGEELQRGAPLLPQGQRLTPGTLAALAMAGVAEVSVHRRARIALLVTGDEVIAPGEALTAGGVYDANGPLLAAWFQARGAETLPVRYVTDHLQAVEDALRLALAEADVVITTGGVSVGDHDHVRAAARAQGAEEVFWRVSQKPGMPLYFGLRSAQAIIGLPGNPAAVLVGLTLHVARVLAVLEGESPPGPNWQRGRLAAEVPRDAKRDLLLRMHAETDADGVLWLYPLGRQGSHMLSNLASANALVRLGPGATAAAGSTAPWLALR